MQKENTEAEKKFFHAIDIGDESAVRIMLAEHPQLLDAFNYNCFGATPITSVTSKGDCQMLSVLLELGADPNRCSDWEMGPWSPLHSAVNSNQEEIVERLLENGAELDVHTAAALGRLSDIERLLNESPRRVSEPGGDGCTPLHFAGTVEAAQMLLDRGADIDARCLDHYSTPVQYLADNRPEIARYLFSRGATVDIFSAAMCGDVGCMKGLIVEDADVINHLINQVTFPPGRQHDVHNIMTFTVGQGCSPIHAAACGDQPEAIRELIECGSDPDVRGGYDNATALHQAAWRNNCSAARQLVDSGADINIRSGDIHNNSPAGWAIVAGSADVFELLMQHNCEVLEWFGDDAQAAVDGKFRQFKCVPQDNYIRIRKCLETKGK